MADRTRRILRARRPTVVALAVMIGAATGGCGLGDPYLASTDGSTTSAPVGARSVRVPAPSAPAARVGAATPSAALRRYATIYVNWTARTLPANLRYLATISTGTARSSALAAARRAAHDEALTRGKLQSRGSVMAITQGLGVDRDLWVVVTRERTRATGADGETPNGTAHVTLASVARVDGRWIVSSWHPQG